MDGGRAAVAVVITDYEYTTPHSQSVLRCRNRKMRRKEESNSHNNANNDFRYGFGIAGQQQ